MMIDFSSVGVIILAAMIHATLQLAVGALLLLYHESLGKHIKIKTKYLVSNYITGSGILIGLMLATICFGIVSLWGRSLPLEGLAVLAGIMVALAICVWFFYYRAGRSTELWLPKVVTRYINRRAKVTESNTEAFALGLLASLAEMPFSLVLMIVAANSILSLPQIQQVAAVTVYVLVAMLPQMFLRFFIRHGRTVADVQKWRVNNKNFFRFLSGAGFMILAGFLVAFKIMGS